MVTAKKINENTRIRVLIVDDSVVIRRLISHVLERYPKFEVVGTAANGVIALKMIPLLKPDVITLDVEMPEMDGLETLRQLRRVHLDLIVIMFSTLTERCAAATMQALTLGANDYVAKAANIGSLDQSILRLEQELIPKIEQFFVRDEPKPPSAVNAAHQDTSVKAQLQMRLTQQRLPTEKRKAYRAVLVGVSTGGPQALGRIFPMLPREFPLPILIVQHMPVLFTRLLAERLQHLTALRVQEGQQGMSVRAGNIYIAPGGFHMQVTRKDKGEELTLNEDAHENSCRPAVDVLFRSAAEAYHASVIAVILTGMGQDGMRGVDLLRRGGAYVIAQDQESSVVWGMPGAVVRAGLADSVVSLQEIVPAITNNL